MEQDIYYSSSLLSGLVINAVRVLITNHRYTSQVCASFYLNAYKLCQSEAKSFTHVYYTETYDQT